MQQNLIFFPAVSNTSLTLVFSLKMYSIHFWPLKKAEKCMKELRRNRGGGVSGWYSTMIVMLKTFQT